MLALPYESQEIKLTKRGNLVGDHIDHSHLESITMRVYCADQVIRYRAVIRPSINI